MPYGIESGRFHSVDDGSHRDRIQGADTVFTQMAAEVLGVTEDKVYIVSTQDTDVTPFDTGAYASRQTYVSGKAVKKTAEMMKDKILEYASWKLKMDQQTLDIRNNMIVTAEGRRTAAQWRHWRQRHCTVWTFCPYHC